jgi:hypothetical protein
LESRTKQISCYIFSFVGRGKKRKKKKKKKKIKKAIIKMIILLILIKLKIVKLLYVFGKLLQFKLVLLVTVNTIINIIRLFMEWRSKKGDNVAYSYEQAHHQHHYDEQHHVDPGLGDEDKGLLSGLWSRSGSYDGNGGVRSVAYAHDIAYSAQKPSQNSAYSTQERSQHAAG